MVASRCASGIGAAMTRSLIWTPSAAKAGADRESVNAATSPTPRRRLFGVLPLLKCGSDGCWACFARAPFSSCDIGKPLCFSLSARGGRLRSADPDRQSACRRGWPARSERSHPCEPDIFFALRVGEEAVKGSNPAGMTGDAIVQADHQHAPSMHALFVELIELVAQRLL